MEHNPYMNLEDDTAITHSDYKKRSDGKGYVTIYFETPTESGFSSMSIDYPNGAPREIKGYSKTEVDRLLYHYRKIGDIIFEDVSPDLNQSHVERESRYA